MKTKSEKLILGIETSCDETAAAVVADGREVLSNVIYTQIPTHTLYGGVVPELASREHVLKINQVIKKALEDAKKAYNNVLLSDKVDAAIISAAQGALDVDGYRAKISAAQTAIAQAEADVAAKEKNEVLILGAFGCGAFHNPPDVVADIFAKLIKNYDFEIVEFAVFCRGDDTSNYDAFKSKFLA